MKNYILTFFIFLMTGISGYIETQAADLRTPSQQEVSASRTDEIKKKNQQKFSALRKYNLPLGQYAIIGSGPLGIRNLREIGDIDIIVSPELRDILMEKYGMVDDGKVKKIVFPEDDIDAFWEGSFYIQPKDTQTPSVADMISRAEIIEGLPFQSLKDVLYFKGKMKRSKDLEDVRLTEEWQKVHSKD